MQKVVGKVLLDDIALVTQANDELRNTLGGVDFHDVPDDRTPSNLDHGLGFQVRLFADASTKPSG